MIRSWWMTAVVALLAACAAPRPATDRNCVLRVGVSGDYAPFSVAAGDGFTGMDVELAERLGRDLGCAVELVTFRWPTLLEQLAGGDFDVAAGGVTMRAERALRGIFSRPYARTGVVVLTASRAAARTLADLDRPRVRVAVNRGGHLERWAEAHLGRADLVTTTDNRSLPALLAEKRVDAIVTDSAEARGWAVGRRLGPFSTDYKALLIAAPRADLAAEVDHWLAARESDGWLAALRVRHLGDAQFEDGRAATGATVQAVAALARLRLSLMPLVAAAKRAAGAAVAAPAQEQRVVARARSWSAHPGPRIDAVFGALIDLAKRIQERSQASPAGSTAPSLETLRAAIANVDRQLVRELDRLASLPAPAAAEWRAALAPVIQDLPLRDDELDSLAGALISRGQGSGAGGQGR